MNREKLIVPAIIAKTKDELNNRVNKVKDVVELIQLDVMDGKFVQNTSLDFDFNLPDTTCRFEAHLMINNPEEWINKNWTKVDTILVHYESCNEPNRVIDLVKNRKKQIGFAINPETPIKSIKQHLDEIDQVLVMTVNPGFYGSPFLPETLDKIAELRRMKPGLNIEVDGGITDSTIGAVDKAGANMFVSGSYIVKSENVKKAIDNLKDQLID